MAVGQHEERDLLAFEQFLDQEVAAEPRSLAKAGVKLLLRAADEHAFAAREAVGLHDAWRPSHGEARPGRNAGRFEDVFREPLRAFDPGRGPAWTEHCDPVPAQEVGKAGDERQLGPDDYEIDPELAAEAENAFGVLGANRVALAEPRDPWVSRRCMERFEARAQLELPGQRVLAAARADDEDPHAAESTGALGLKPARRGIPGDAAR